MYSALPLPQLRYNRNVGGDIACLATYSLLSNMTVAIIAPFIFSFMGDHISLPFFESFLKIGTEMIPLLILPFICALTLQKFLPKVHSALQNRQSISFYLWAISLTIVMGKTVSFIASRGSAEYKEEILCFFCSYCLHISLYWAN